MPIREHTTDPELAALAVIADALAPLDIETCVRVIKWAQDRYIEERKREVSELAWTSVDGQVKAYKKWAERLGVDDRKLAHALAHARQMKALAPLEHDPDPEATVKEAVEAIGGNAR